MNSPSAAPLEGVLFFPVTPFDRHGQLNTAALTAHVARGVDAGPGAVFVACGTGEFHALDLEEYARAVQAAVEAVDGRVPVFAGTGGALPLARQYAAAAARAGADGLLLLPPYLVSAPTIGIADYVAAVAHGSPLPLIVYQRNNALFTPETAVRVARLPNVIGFKDGLGNLDLMQRIVLSVRGELQGRPFQFFNGMPTAEMSQLAYAAIGVPLYSSAVFCFAPEISLAFHRALHGNDRARIEQLLSGFFQPLVELRDLVPGYAVSLVKAAVRMAGLDVGPVRPPLIEPEPAHLSRLEAIIAAGRALCADSVAAAGADGTRPKMKQAAQTAGTTG